MSVSSAKLLEHKFIYTDGNVTQRLSPVPRRIGSRAWILPMSLGAPAVDHKLSRLAARPKRQAVLTLAMLLLLEVHFKQGVSSSRA